VGASQAFANALEDVRRAGSAPARQLAAEAGAWFASEADEHPFAFVAICSSLGLNASAGPARRRGEETEAAVTHRRAAWLAARGGQRPSGCLGYPPVAGWRATFRL